MITALYVLIAATCGVVNAKAYAAGRNPLNLVSAVFCAGCTISIPASA